jgi:glycogen debranching enzyme
MLSNLFRTDPRRTILLLVVVLISTVSGVVAEDRPQSLELSRPVRGFEFLPIVGQKAGLFGNETGNFEAWVYPLKILRNFHLNFLTEGRVLPAETLARTLIVRPESATIVYSGDTFSVRETMFVPVQESGAVITFEVDTVQPLEIEAIFQRDFQLMWPAAVGGTYISWDANLRAFYFGEEQKKYAAYVGSPTVSGYREEYVTNYSASGESSLRLGATNKGKDTKLIAIAGSMQGPAEAEKTYRHLVDEHANLLQQSADYYRNYLAQTVNLELPDTKLQTAYDWSRISMLQGVVASPFLGEGLVAGYRTSGDSGRPGFAWFFGRDSLWTDMALDASGDYATTRTALDFLSKYQREDGKVEHEIAQSASLVPWFRNFPYAYASADATPLYIITMNDYAMHSGDVAFVQEKWDSIWKAYQFLRSTYDAQGFPQNFGIGHGWVEGGPLLPVKAELYQVGLGAEALRSLASLARLAKKNDVAPGLEQDFEKLKTALNEAFWSAEKKFFAYAIDKDSKRMDTASVLTTVPMWFGVLDEKKTEATIDQLAEYDHQTDWGMRIISSNDPHYNPGGYHFGAVWPLFTGWASVGEYRYHRALPAYANLRANALQVLDGSLGHVTEVLSGDYYQQLSTSSPHQIWSAAMVVSPLLRGMLGLEENAASQSLSFSPHLPADWTWLSVRNVHVADCVLSLEYHKAMDGITLEIKNGAASKCSVEFSPGLSLRAEVVGAELNDHKVDTKTAANSYDQHVIVRAPVEKGTTTIRIRTRDDFGVSVAAAMPALGSSSQGLRITSETWSANHASLELGVSGIPGHAYDLAVWNVAQITSLDGAEVIKSDHGESGLRVRFPASASSPYSHSKVTIHFSAKK